MARLPSDGGERPQVQGTAGHNTKSAEAEWLIAKSRWEQFERTGICLDHSEIEAWAASLQAKRNQ